MRTFKYLKKYSLAILIPGAIFSSCKKQDLDEPKVDVTVAKTTYAVNEPIVFQFTGTSDAVSFFSGAKGAAYMYKDRKVASGQQQLQFATYRQGTSTQAGTLSVMASKNFSGTYDIDNVKAATWTDLTSRATLSTGADNTASGVVDVSDQMVQDGYTFFAFKYAAVKDVVAQPTWTVKNVTLNVKTADGSVLPMSTNLTNTISWGAVNVLNTANVWNTTSLLFTGGAANTDDNEDWLISQPIQLGRVVPDYGTNIKPSPTTTLVTYTFPGYTAAGTYTATFEFTNSNRWGIKKEIKEFTFKVQ